ncbi:MAG: hypothetical protein AB9873_19395 [Syntrophobacteraceae bacterium]
MRCQKCGYVSFDHLLACKKCGNDATAARDALGLMAGKPATPFFLGALISGGDTAPAAAVTAPPPAPKETAHEDMDSLFAEIDFGADDLEFDLTEEPSPMSGATAAAAAATNPRTAGRDQSDLDDFEIEMASALDEELAIDMSDLDESPSEVKVREDDFQLDFDLEEPKTVASAKAPAAGSTNGGIHRGDEGEISLSLDTDMDFELDLGDLVPPQPEEAKAAATGLEEEMVIDLGDDELTGLIQEIEDSKKGAKASV